MKIKKSLQPVALALPGLLISTVHAGFLNSSVNPNPANSTWQGSATKSTGYTAAAYSGNATTLTGKNLGYDNGQAQCIQVGSTQVFNNVTAASISYTWSSITYDYGHSQLVEQSTGQGADGWVWNNTQWGC